MIYQATIHFLFCGQLEIPAVDETTARLELAGFQSAVIQEPQNFVGIRLNKGDITSQVETPIEELAGPIFRFDLSFSFKGGLTVDSADDHEARGVLATLENLMLDEQQNWPISEQKELEVSAKLLNLDL